MSEPLTREEQALARSAMDMVQRYARRFARQWPRVSEEDFRSVGNEAVTVAARQFDKTSEFPFGAYAKKRIRGRMTDLATGEVFGQDAVLRTVRHAAEHVPELREAETDETVLQDEDPATSRVKTIARYRVRAAEWAIAALLAAAPSSDPEALLVQHEEAARVSRSLSAAVASLDEHHRVTVLKFFEERATLEVIATELGVSKKSVQRYLLRALDVLRKALAAGGVETAPEPL